MTIERMTEPDHCASIAFVMLPDASSQAVACNKSRPRHGRWHQNRDVRWRGSWQEPVMFPEWVDEQVDKMFTEDSV